MHDRDDPVAEVRRKVAQEDEPEDQEECEADQGDRSDELQQFDLIRIQVEQAVVPIVLHSLGLGR